MVTLRDLDYVIAPFIHCIIEEIKDNLDFVSIYDGEWIKSNFHSNLFEVIDIQPLAKGSLYIFVKRITGKEKNV